MGVKVQGKSGLREQGGLLGKGHSGARAAQRMREAEKKPCFPDNHCAGPFNRTFIVHYCLISATQQRKHFTEKVLEVQSDLLKVTRRGRGFPALKVVKEARERQKLFSM